jgi:hypothetical protein
MTIREMCDAFDVTARTLRFYEAEGTDRARSAGPGATSPIRDRARLKLILRGKRFGFSSKTSASFWISTIATISQQTQLARTSTWRSDRLAQTWNASATNWTPPSRTARPDEMGREDDRLDQPPTAAPPPSADHRDPRERPMPRYTAPVKDLQFVLHDVLKVSGADIPGYGDLDASFTAAVLEEAGKLASEVLAPLNAVGDREGCRLENGVVRTPDGLQARPSIACARAAGPASTATPTIWRAGPALPDGHRRGRDVRRPPTWPSTCIRA